ncbi:MAG: hypothetical protein LBC08_02695 [Campylobacteraceae bacterium]|jgi:hypothetical protein|nr:hypothetical protein [Campylobacteraceae bacterium]
MVAKSLDLAKQRRIEKDILDCFVALRLAMMEKVEFYHFIFYMQSKIFVFWIPAYAGMTEMG